MNSAYILLGTNLGDKTANLTTACEKIISRCGSITKQSELYETAPWGMANQDAFLNQVIQIETNHSPEKLLEILLSIEIEMGRVRLVKWGERLIDLDILYFNKDIITKESLKIPHPEIQNRMFVLVPLCEIAADYKHPVLNITNQQLFKLCTDQ